ncbi:hypothetical protein [Sphingobacterium zeae]|uniref:hypothetical protein n=1 Tax=Sphingobacterium zeae TaxID=1776859 RepID=UPI003615EC7E
MEGGVEVQNQGGAIAYFVKLNEVVVNGIRSTQNYFNNLTWSQAWDDVQSGTPGHQYSRYVIADIQKGNYVGAAAGMANATADIFTLGIGFTTKPAQLIVTESLVSTKQIASKEVQELAKEMRITSGSELSKIGNQAAKGGIEAANGLKISGFTIHGVDRAIGDFSRAGVKPNAILDALKNPLKINNIATDALGRQSQRFIGQFGEVVVNPQTGRIISVNPTSTSKAARLLKQIGQ